MNKNIYAKNIFLILLLIILLMMIHFQTPKKKIGVIGVRHCNNIGANLLKYAMSIKLTELGFIPYIIGTHYKNRNIRFLKKNTNCIIIKNNFSEIKKKDFDFLMVNSDQTWRKFDNFFYDHAFLKFSKNWNKPKFIYGASLGYSKWKFSKKEDIMIKNLLKKFTGISTREKGSIKLIKKHLGIKAVLVLDPTLLIDKKYYLKILSDYVGKKPVSNNYIFTYLIKTGKKIKSFINNSSKLLGYELFNADKFEINSIEKFIYGIANCKAVITNSYHGTIFSIIFNKPFVVFLYKGNPSERFKSLGEILRIKNRIFNYYESPNINLLMTPLNINYTYINFLKNFSINYIKKNLGLIF